MLKLVCGDRMFFLMSTSSEWGRGIWNLATSSGSWILPPYHSMIFIHFPSHKLSHCIRPLPSGAWHTLVEKIQLPQKRFPDSSISSLNRVSRHQESHPTTEKLLQYFRKGFNVKFKHDILHYENLSGTEASSVAGKWTHNLQLFNLCELSSTWINVWIISLETIYLC